MFRVQAVPYLPKASEMLSTGLQFYLQDTWHLVWRTRQIMKFIKWELNTALVLPMELWAEFSVREGVGSVKIDGLRSLFLDWGGAQHFLHRDQRKISKWGQRSPIRPGSQDLVNRLQDSYSCCSVSEQTDASFSGSQNLAQSKRPSSSLQIWTHQSHPEAKTKTNHQTFLCTRDTEIIEIGQ